MNIAGVRDALIPLLKTYAGIPIIEADQGGEVPEGNHAVYKFTSPYIRENQRPNVIYNQGNVLSQTQSEEYRITLSITAVAEDNDDSLELAQALYDWFSFHGQDHMLNADIVPLSIGDIANRDSVNDDETRQGFDVTFRVSRELVRDIDFFESIEINQ
jgi:hypothetical protein